MQLLCPKILKKIPKKTKTMEQDEMENYLLKNKNIY